MTTILLLKLVILIISMISILVYTMTGQASASVTKAIIFSDNNNNNTEYKLMKVMRGGCIINEHGSG